MKSYNVAVDLPRLMLIGDEFALRARPVPTPDGTRSFELTQAGARVCVIASGPDGPTCSCELFARHRECPHLEAALESGLL